MEKQFDLVLTNHSKSGWLAATFVLATTFGLATIIVGLTYVEYSDIFEQAILYGLLLVAIYGFTHLIKKIGIEPSLVTITANELQVVNTKSGEQKLVEFNDVVSYRYRAYRGGKELRLKSKDYKTLRLSSESKDFNSMVAAFELALAQHQKHVAVADKQVEATRSPKPLQATVDASDKKRALSSPASLREAPFFEKSVSTVVLVFFGSVLAAFTIVVATGDKSVPSGLITGYGGFITYFGIWLAASRKRRLN